MSLIRRVVCAFRRWDHKFPTRGDQSVHERRERLRLMQSLEGQSLLQRIRGEYREMPGLQLTAEQAQRFWNLDQRTTKTLLHALAASRFLRLRRNGTFVLNQTF